MNWTFIVTALQVVAGLLWLIPAVYLTPRIIHSWQADASRRTILTAPIGFLAWLQVGFTVRWLVWPHALEDMRAAELITWGALYALSGLLALWFFAGARSTKGE